MKRPHALALALLLLAAGAMLSTMWLAAVRAQALRQRPSPPPGELLLTPHAIQGRATMLDGADAAPRRDELHDALDVTGTLVELGAVTLLLERDDGTILKLGRSDAEGRFRFHLTAPLDDVGVRTLERDGKQRRHHFTRDAASGRTDWDLGRVDFPGERIMVRLQIDYDAAVVARMVACQHRKVTARVRESRSNGPVLYQHEFELGQLPPAERSAAHEASVESHGNGDLAVEWIGHGVHWPWDHPAFQRDELLPAALGSYRSTRLTLRPESVVEGHMSWSDGTPCDEEWIQYDSDLRDGPRCLTLVTNHDGGFLFVVGQGDRGRLAMDTLLAALLEEPQPPLPVATGSSVEWHTVLSPVRFRLIGDTGSPIERFRVRGWWQTARPADLHPGGLAFNLRQCLERHPWLEFTVDGHQRVVAVPPTWFEGVAVHEVHTSEFAPAGSLLMRADDLPEPARERVVDLKLYATGELRGYSRTQGRSGKRPWRIADLPAGTYEYEVTGWPGLATPATGTVTIAPGCETDLRLR